MKNKIICICLLNLLSACTKTSNEPDAVSTTVSGTVFHKYYNTPYKNALITITYDDIDFRTLSTTPINICTTNTDDNGHFSCTFAYNKDYYGVKINVPDLSLGQPIHKGENHFDFKVAPPVIVKTAIHFYKNRFPPMSVQVGYTSYYDSPLWEKFSGDTTIYQIHQYDQPFKITYTNYNTAVSGGVEHIKILGAYADTLSVTDTINMDF